MSRSVTAAAVNIRHRRLRTVGSWLAFAGPCLLALGAIYLVAIALAHGFDYLTTFGPAPDWVNRALNLLGVILGVYALSAVALLIVAAIEAAGGRTGLVVIGAVTAAASVIGLLMGSFGSVILLAGGACLASLTQVGIRRKRLYAAPAWIGTVAGVLIAAAGLFGWNGAAILIPAAVLYLVWSVWLGVEFRQRGPGGPDAPDAAPAAVSPPV